MILTRSLVLGGIASLVLSAPAQPQTVADLTAIATHLRIERVGDSGAQAGEALRLRIPIPESGLTASVTALAVTREILWLGKDILGTAFDPLNPFDLTAVASDVVGRLPTGLAG